MADILFEDRDILVVRKPAGVESQRGKSFAMDLESELKNLLAARNPGTVPYLGVVHRLDRPVAGIMVYAKTKAAAAGLSKQFAAGGAHKIYEALVISDSKDNPDSPQDDAKELRDFMVSDARSNLTRIVCEGTPGAKEAKLRYQFHSLEEAGVFSVREDGSGGYEVSVCGQPAGNVAGAVWERVRAVRIELLTGRHHQIRAQLAHMGFPILGDSRYGKEEEGVFMRGKIALCAASLTFRHPATGKKMQFHAAM